MALNLCQCFLSILLLRLAIVAALLICARIKGGAEVGWKQPSIAPPFFGIFCFDVHENKIFKTGVFEWFLMWFLGGFSFHL
ncbi:MAG: hypothetical protein ACOYBT_10300 [Polynucleobacter sp.]